MGYLLCEKKQTTGDTFSTRVAASLKALALALKERNAIVASVASKETGWGEHAFEDRQMGLDYIFPLMGSCLNMNKPLAFQFSDTKPSP